MIPSKKDLLNFDIEMSDKEYKEFIGNYNMLNLEEEIKRNNTIIPLLILTLITFILAFFISTLLAISSYSKYKYAVIEYQKANDTATYYINLNKDIMQVNEELNFKLGNFERQINNVDTKD